MENHCFTAPQMAPLAAAAITSGGSAELVTTYTPAAARLPEQKEAVTQSDRLLDELERADEIVLGVAVHNFSIPSVLKLWIDQVVRAGRSFRYGPDGA